MNTQQALQLAFQHLNSGNLPAASQLFNSILQQEPQNFAALNGRGFIALQQNQLAQAQADLQSSLSINPKQPFAHKMVGIVLGAMGRFDESMAAFAAALALDARDPEVYFNRANFRFQAGRVQEALADLDDAIKLNASYLEARSNRATLLIQKGDFAGAETDLDYLVNKVSNNPNVWVALGLVKHKVSKFKEAMLSNERALILVPNHPDALLNSSSAMYDQGEYAAALNWAEKAIAVTPQRAEPHYARAQALMALHRFGEALTAYSKAIELNPNYAEAFMGRGLTRVRLRALDEAVVDYDRAITLKPDYVEALNNLGAALLKRGSDEMALSCFERAIESSPNDFLSNINKARALSKLKRLGEAKGFYLRAQKIGSSGRWLQGEFADFYSATCDWLNHQRQCVKIYDGVKHGAPVSHPFSLMASKADSPTKLLCAEIYSTAKFPSAPFVLNDSPPVSKDNRLVVAYISSDFFNHATSHLIAELFEIHDRTKFEVVGICYGEDAGDAMRERIIKSFDRFFAVKSLSDEDIALLLKDVGVHIAVDLKGHTKDSRLGIFARRVAPIQIHYLGFPGSIGADFIDYLVADDTLIPTDDQQFYSEKIIYLPDSYQVNDRLKQISSEPGTRAHHGLPDGAFVFCCFNNSWKITPDVFDVWMRLLTQVEDSVLWLIQDNEEAVHNLTREAEKRGICRDRLVFANKLPLDEHLARHKHADLFLDTFSCNAHTTASDALWAGLPMITKLGDTFAGRVGASLLNAVDLSELVTKTPESYESLALTLARDRQELMTIRKKLETTKLDTRLFDTTRFARNLEAAYEEVWMRYQSGLAPDHVCI